MISYRNKENEVAQKRTRISPAKKVEILRELLENRRTITDVAEHYGVHPNMIGRYKKEMFEGAIETFTQKKKSGLAPNTKKIRSLEETLQKRNMLIAELVSENVELKKTRMGTVKRCLGGLYCS